VARLHYGRALVGLALGLILASPPADAASKSPAKAVDCNDAFAKYRLDDKHPPIPKECLANDATPAPPAPRTVSLRSATPTESPACAKLGADYENASKELAMTYAEGVGDNSAPRATMREARNGNVLEKARLTVELMRGNSCRIPTEPPSLARYLSPALACQTALLGAQGGNLPPACDMSTWQPKAE
jgi:hypothetical protein